MKKIVPIREFFKFTTKELLEGLKTNLNVQFEDGAVRFMPASEIMLTRCILSITHVIPELIIVEKYAISNYYTNGTLTSKSINRCFEVILEDMVNNFIRATGNRAILPLIYAAMYKVIEVIKNDVIRSKTEYASSINIMDFLEIQFDERLLDAMRDVDTKKDVDSVNKTYDILEDILYNKPTLKNNTIAKGYAAKTVNPNQIKQMLASRGYVTEIDSNIFKYPIASSFTLGMANLYDLTIESRAAAKALSLSNRAIQTSEYFARELQLVTMMVEHLIDGDCGNTEYVNWYVRPMSIIGKSDIDNMLGKRFLNEAGVEEVITSNHKWLEGTTIKLRTAMNCKLEYKNSICTTCFGDLSYGIHAHTNIGHLSSTSVTQKVTQSILSTKHLTSSATSNDIKLDNTTELFFNVKGKNNYAFKANLISKIRTSYKMIVNQKDAFGIKDLPADTDVYKLDPARISRIESIIIVTTNNGVDEHYPIIIKDSNKYGSFTYEFLKYILTEGYTLDDNDRYIINLDNWTTTENVITMPQLEYNFLQLAKNIKAVFKYMDIVKGERSAETQESMLQKLFDLVNSKLDVNIALLEVIVYAFTIMSIKNNNYDIGRNSDDKQLMRIKGILTNRSLGGAYAWEEVKNTILSPTSFSANKVDHPLDVLILPEQTIRDYYGK